MKTILIIEDEKVLLKKIQQKFIKKDYNVLVARNINEVFVNVFKKNKTNIIDLNVIKKGIEHLENLEKVDTIWLDHDVYDEKQVEDFIQKFEVNRPSIREIPILVISSKENKKIESSLNLNISKYYIRNKEKFNDAIDDIGDSIKIKLDYCFGNSAQVLTETSS